MCANKSVRIFCEIVIYLHKTEHKVCSREYSGAYRSHDAAPSGEGELRHVQPALPPHCIDLATGGAQDYLQLAISVYVTDGRPLHHVHNASPLSGPITSSVALPQAVRLHVVWALVEPPTCCL